uniref:Uncharacterized protein n=1 Tax=Anguilla anguilla TaxID=7936 RepID=A0A0E9TEW3_ANGAN
MTVQIDKIFGKTPAACFVAFANKASMQFYVALWSTMQHCIAQCSAVVVCYSCFLLFWFYPGSCLSE